MERARELIGYFFLAVALISIFYLNLRRPGHDSVQRPVVQAGSTLAWPAASCFFWFVFVDWRPAIRLVRPVVVDFRRATS